MTTDQYQTIRERITTLLTYYGPRLSESMIAAHVGSYASRYRLDWKHALHQLVEDGTVVRRAELHGSRSSTVYMLRSTEVNEVLPQTR